MNSIEKKDIRNLLVEAKRFCNGIMDKSEALGLSQREVGTFSIDVDLLRYVIDHDDSFTESFISYNAISIQWRLTDMLSACINSDNYTDQIGSELGIRLPLNNTLGLNAMKLKWSSEQTYSSNKK